VVAATLAHQLKGMLLMSFRRRRFRGTCTAAAATLALLALPAAAHAAPSFSLSVSSPGPFTAGETVPVVVEITNTGDAVGGAVKTVKLTDNASAVEVVGVPTIEPGSTAVSQVAQVTVADGDANITVKAGFDEGSAKVTMMVKLPFYYTTSLKYRVMMTPSALVPVYDVKHVVSRGGPSDVETRFATATPKWVVKDGTLSTTVDVTNQGAAAENVAVRVTASGSAADFSPSWGVNPAFTPNLTYPGGCVPAPESSCLLGTIAPGQTVSLPIKVDALTHYGTLDLGASTKGGDVGVQSGHYRDVRVSDGTTGKARIELEGPKTAAGNTDVVYDGSLVNAGPDAIGMSTLRIKTDTFTPTGQSEYDSGPDSLEPIRSITLTNGSTCTPRINHFATPEVAYKGSWECPIAGFAVGQRIGFRMVASFPTTIRNETVDIVASFDSTSFLGIDSTPAASVYTTLNVTRSADLQTSVTAQALIGADRWSKVTVTVRNGGNTAVDTATVDGTIYSGMGEFSVASLPATCSGVVKPRAVRCSLGTIEPGASTTLTLDVKAGTALGTLTALFTADADGDWYELNRDDDSATVSMQIVKASAVPFTGAAVFMPLKRNLTQLPKIGMLSRVRCPQRCRAVVKLQVSSAVAQRLGLARKPRRGTAPAFYVIGFGAKARSSAGRVTVIARINKRYGAKLLKLRTTLVVQRVTTVMSTDAASRGASYQKVQAFAIKPAPRKPVRRPKPSRR
jgi:hypothetical protein